MHQFCTPVIFVSKLQQSHRGVHLDKNTKNRTIQTKAGTQPSSSMLPGKSICILFNKFQALPKKNTKKCLFMVKGYHWPLPLSPWLSLFPLVSGNLIQRSISVLPTVTTKLQRTVTTGLYGETGTTPTDAFLIALVKGVFSGASEVAWVRGGWGRQVAHHPKLGHFWENFKGALLIIRLEQQIQVRTHNISIFMSFGVLPQHGPRCSAS